MPEPQERLAIEDGPQPQAAPVASDDHGQRAAEVEGYGFVLDDE